MNEGDGVKRIEGWEPYGEGYRLCKQNRGTWRARAAALGFVGGAVSLLLGSLLTLVAWFEAATRVGASLNRLGLVFFLLSFPLLALGAHCLDLLEKTSRAAAPPDASRAGNRRIVNLHEARRMSRRRLNGVALLTAAALPFLHAPNSRAQQTIFNVPTTDVLERGKVYAELDASFKPNDSEAVARFSSFVPRILVGAGRRVEVGLNVTGNVQPGPDATTLVPTFKFKAYDGGKNGWAIVAGDHLFFPVRNRAYTAGNYVYAEASKTFKSGTRLTAGGYDFTRNVVAPANRAGGQFGFEQPVNKQSTLAADYFTGKHAAGYFTPGVIFKVGKKATGYAGYSVGNQNSSRGNNFFLLEFGYNFN